MHKSELIHIRISPKDKADAKRMAKDKAMSLSEYLVYLIRRERDTTCCK